MPGAVLLNLKILHPILVFLSLFLVWNALETRAFAAIDDIRAETNRQKDINKVLSTLENRMSDKCVLNKAREKLWLMPVPKLRLMSLLCDRISTAHESAVAADIAYSLVSAMIVLS